MKNDLRILLLEDIPSDAELIEHEIRKTGLSFTFRIADTRQDFVRSLREFCPDVILSDYRLPEFNGIEALDLTRKHAAATPFLMVTGSLDEVTAVECMKAGAWDYILKDNLYRIGPAIAASVEKKQALELKEKAEQALERSRNFYLNLFELSPALIWRAGPEGNLDYFNRNWLSFTGTALDRQIGNGWTDGVHPDDADDVKKEFRNAFSMRIPFDIEFRLRRHDGAYRWIRAYGRPFDNEQGIFSGFICYCFDTTERYQAEELLRKLSRAVEQSTTAILITDTEGCIEYANRSYSEMTGYSLVDLIGRNALTSEEDPPLPDVFGPAWETLIGGGEWRGEICNLKRNGEPYWEYATFSPIMNAEDVVTHFLVEKEDITSRKETEWKLSQSRAELWDKHRELRCLYEKVSTSKREWENTMDCIGDIVILIDTNGVIKRCNKALRDFTGLSYPDILGANWRELLCLHGLPLPDDIAAGTELKHPGSGRWFTCRSYPFTDTLNNESCGFVITMHDSTERKRVTAELEKAYGKLQSTQAQVIQQEKMASIGQLAAGVAHEINNPMGFISCNLGTLSKYLDRLTEFIRTLSKNTGGEDCDETGLAISEKRKTLKIDMIIEDAPDLIKESLEGAERIQTIVKNLKNFSRVDEAQYKSADINECIESTLNIVWNELKYKVKLTKELGEIPLTKCYPQQLNQVFMNLLINASQAIEGQGEISVRTWSDDESIYSSVSDTGCGIPESTLSRIFDPFFTTKEVGKGTGLGLSITYDIVKNHQGDISVESEPGRGTTFTVRIPIVEEAGNG
jgi:two-component system NtrC family sensor kinase